MYVYVIHHVYCSISIQYSLALDYSFSPEIMHILIRDKTFVQLDHILNMIMIFVSFFLETFSFSFFEHQLFVASLNKNSLNST